MGFLATTLAAKFGKFPFFWGKENDVGETPEVYLQLTTECMEQASKVSPGSLKFNRGQCNYLVEKLKVSVQSARSLLEPKNFDDANLAYYREVFKFLYSLSKEVESFINTCYRNEWIEAAVSMLNVDKHVSSIGFNLEVFAIVFSDGKKQNGRSLTLARVTRISKAEVETVEKEAIRDKLELCKNLKSLIGSSKASQRWDLAHFLLERLERSSAPISPPVSSSSDLREGYFTGLKPGTKLGSGGFADVYQSEWLGVSVAEKVFRGQGDDDFKQECSIYLKLSHPNILCLFGFSVKKVTCSLVMERMDNDLLSLICDRANHGPPFTILEVVDIMHQMAEGVFYLHENKVVHRDLKSKNILYKCVKTSNQMETAIHVKVADFGLSKIKEKSRTLSNQTPNMGTDRWMAPEVIRILNQDNHTMISESEEKYPFKCDVYSFAMVCYELLTGLQPFHSITLPRIVKKKVLDGERPKLPDHCPDLLRTLIEKCWSQDPKARPDFGDICEELRYLKCLLINGIFDIESTSTATKWIRAIIPNTTEAATLEKVNAKAWILEIESRMRDFGCAFDKILPDREEVPVLVIVDSRSGHTKFYHKGRLHFEGVRMPMDVVLDIIRRVNFIADYVRVNKNQCKRLAEQIGDVGKALEALINRHNEVFFEASVKEQILRVLRKGEALIQDNANKSRILQNDLRETENSFKEVHNEIDDILETYLFLHRTEKDGLLSSSDLEVGQVPLKVHKLRMEDISEGSKIVEGNVEDTPEGSGSMVQDDVENIILEKIAMLNCRRLELLHSYCRN